MQNKCCDSKNESRPKKSRKKQDSVFGAINILFKKDNDALFKML